MSGDHLNVRDQIIASLFRKVNADGIVEETYVSHVKVWEEVTPGHDAPTANPGAIKPRYILVAGWFLTFSSQYRVTECYTVSQSYRARSYLQGKKKSQWFILYWEEMVTLRLTRG